MYGIDLHSLDTHNIYSFLHILQASVRVQDNLAMAISDKNKKIFQQMSEISEDVVKKGGTVPEHPLGF